MAGIPTRYRSLFTGIEIDRILASVQNKIDVNYIVNDFTTGGERRVASAELAKILRAEIDIIRDPNFFAGIISQIQGFNVFTDDQKIKLEQLSTDFVGSFPNATARDEAVNVVGMKGGEFAFLDSDGRGYQEISYWHPQSLSWRKANLYDLGDMPDQTFVATGKHIVFSFNKTEREFVKIFMLAKQSLGGVDTFTTQAVTMGYVFGDVWFELTDQISNSLNPMLSNFDFTVEGDFVRMTLTLPPSTTVSIRKVFEL